MLASAQPGPVRQFRRVRRASRRTTRCGPTSSTCMTPKRRRLGGGHLDAGDRDVGAGVHVLDEHALVVHLVDVVARENDEVLGRVAVDDVDVLEHRVGGARVPLVLGDALARGQDVEALVAHRLQEVPAALQVADQAVRLVLRGDRDAPDAGVERVRQREIDDARLPAEVHGGLGPPFGQLHEPRAAPAGQHVGHRRARERGRVRHLVHRIASGPRARLERTCGIMKFLRARARSRRAAAARRSRSSRIRGCRRDGHRRRRSCRNRCRRRPRRRC